MTDDIPQEYKISISLIISALFISVAIWLKPSLEFIESMFSIVGSLSVAVALAAYLNKKHQDVTAAAIDQISFFRKEIIFANEEFVNFVREKKGKDFVFYRVGLDEPSIDYTRKKFGRESLMQADLIKELDTLLKQTAILNMLEELSLRVLHLKTINHPALSSIMAPFVELVEIHAVILLFHREISTGTPTYSSIIKIYLEWKDKVDRRYPEERLKEVRARLGLISK